MKRHCICLVLVFLRLICSAQTADSSVHRLNGLQAHYGFIIPHSEEIEQVSNTNPIGFELDLIKLNKSYKSWSVFSTYWFHGIQGAYMNFQDPGVLGGAFLLTAFAEPVIVNRGRFLFTLRGGTGLSYHTKIYDETENPENKFFCTRICFPLYISARFRYRISPELFLTFSGYYNHISNGGIKQPNYGMNFPTLAVGIERMRIPLVLERRPFRPEDSEDLRGWYYRVQVFASYKVTDKTDIYPYKGALVSGMGIAAFRRLGLHYALGFGAEYANDRALKEQISREGLDTDNRRAALIAGQDFHFGKVIFSQHFGFYIYSPYKAPDPVYQMYGLGARLHRRIMAGVFIKAHRHVADFMGINVSYLPGKIK